MKRFLRLLLRLVVGFLVVNTLVRILKNFYEFPLPEWMADLIDNPLRRRLVPPGETAVRMGARPGLRLLEVGPGNGTYTAAVARAVGAGGQVVAIDINPRMVERVQARMRAEGIANVEARAEDVYALPFPDGHFDGAYMITVLGEIPEPERALKELHRVVRTGGTLAVQEIAVDPDYSRDVTVVRLASAAGWQVIRKWGHFFFYSLVFEK